MAVKLNTPGHDDGTVEVWIDETPVLGVAGLHFRDTPELKVDGLLFSTFFGGGDESWVTPVDTDVEFAAFGTGPGYLGAPGKVQGVSHGKPVRGPSGPGSTSALPVP